MGRVKPKYFFKQKNTLQIEKLEQQQAQKNFLLQQHQQQQQQQNYII